jgi:hypothetical protein
MSQLIETAIRRGMIKPASKPTGHPGQYIPVIEDLVYAHECRAVARQAVSVKIGTYSFMLDLDAARALRRQLDNIVLEPTQNGVAAVFEVLRERFGLSETELKADGREQPRAFVRQIAYYLMTRSLGMAHAAVGRVFGIDHGTVAYGANKIEAKAEKERAFAEEISDLKNHLSRVWVKGKQRDISTQ